MDLKTIRVDDEPVDLIIKDIDGNDTDLVLRVVGLDNSEYKKIDRNLTRKALSYGDIKSMPDDEIDKMSNSRVAALIKDWKNLQEDGKDVPYSSDEALRIVSSYPVIKDQVMKFCVDRANFIKG